MAVAAWFPVAWSPTSLAGLEVCPRRWALRRAGYRPAPNPLVPPSPHADFGKMWHAAAEAFDRYRYNGVGLDRATEGAINFALDYSWRAGSPWGGVAADLWTCRDGVSRSTASGRRKFTCDAARDWWLGGPDRCPKCHGPVNVETRYVPAHPTKNRVTLLRAVEAYCANASEFGVVGDDRGPLLEREFEFDWGDGVPGHMIADRLSTMQGVSGRLGHERKTTARAPWRGYWDGLKRSYQTAAYRLGAGVRDIVYEVVVVSTKGVEVTRQILSPDRTLVEEAAQRAAVLAREANDGLAAWGDDPLRWAPCFAVCAIAAGGQPCEYLALCNSPVGARAHRLASDFVVEARN